MQGSQVDVRAVTEGRAAGESGVEHGETLVAFAEAAVAGDDASLARARGELLECLGPEKLVDAAAVVANFQRMDRIADSTGIALDTPLELATGRMRERLDLGRFASAANTAATAPLKRALGRLLEPIAPRVMGLTAAVLRRFASR